MKSHFAFLATMVFAGAACGSDAPTPDPKLEALATAPRLTGDDPHWILDASSGCWVFDGYPSARETATWSGPCKDKIASGVGTVTWYLAGKRDETRSGPFLLGSLNGHGTATMSDGSTYEGEWVYGARFGFGVLKRANGDIYQGMWPGSGTYTRPDGRTCAAQARRHGEAVVIDAPCATGIWASH